MIEEGSYVRYGSNGIFKVVEIIRQRSMDGVVEDWYKLASDKGGVTTSISTKATNPSIRPVLTQKEIIKLIHEMPNIPDIWCDDKRLRMDQYRAVMDSNDMYELVQIIKSIYLAKQKKESDGKHLSEKDKEVFDNAEQLLFEEIS